MSKRILFLFFIFILVIYQGYGQISDLNKKLSQAPDSLKALIFLDIAHQYESNHQDSCVKYARKSTLWAQKNNQDTVLINAEKILYRIAIKNNELQSATSHQQKILDAALRTGKWDVAAQSYYHLGEIWQFRNNYAESIENLKKGLKIAKQQPQKVLLRDYYILLIQAYTKLNNAQALSEYYPLLMDVSKEIDISGLNGQMAELQKKYEALSVMPEMIKSDEKPSRKNMDPIFLWAILVTILFICFLAYYLMYVFVEKSKDRKKHDEAIQKLNILKKDQETLFHFLTAYTHPKMIRLRENLDKDRISSVNDEIEALYYFFQNFLLLLQSRSKQLVMTPGTVNIPQMANNLMENYKPLADKQEIQLINDVQNNVFARTDERLIGIVLNNLFRNAFTFVPQKGLITLGAKENHVNVSIWVANEGIGMEPGKINQLFDFDKNISVANSLEDKKLSINLMVCKELVEVCNGRIWVETKLDKEFCIGFDLPKSDTK
jgi:tetratricopeptide (TPR) repeat protein